MFDDAYGDDSRNFRVTERLIAARQKMDDEFREAPHLSKVREKLFAARGRLGQQVGIRVDIPSARRGIGVVAVHAFPHGGVVIGYDNAVCLSDASFIVHEGGMRAVGAEGENKFPFAFIGGRMETEISLSNVIAEGEGQLVDFATIYYNPRRVHLFINAATGQAIRGARGVFQVGRQTVVFGADYYSESDMPAAPEGMNSLVGTPLSHHPR